MRLSAVTSAKTELVRTIIWNSGSHSPVLLAVKIQYIPPDSLREQSETEKAQILSARKLTPVENVPEINDAIQRIWCAILSSAIKSITLPGGAKVTLKEMSSLVSLSTEAVKSMGGLSAELPLSVEDTSSITPEDRAKYGHGEDVKTMADVAKQNIQYLLRVVAPFRQFVESVVADISYFQDRDWEKQLKN